jgi:hypothetical protein
MTHSIAASMSIAGAAHYSGVPDWRRSRVSRPREQKVGLDLLPSLSSEGMKLAFFLNAGHNLAILTK